VRLDPEWFDNHKGVMLESDEPLLEDTRMAFDLLIKNAKTRFSERPVDVGIRDGRIASIRSSLAPKADQTIDAAGKLVTESYVNGHLHLCKVYTLRMVGEKALTSYQAGSMGGVMTAIELASKVKEKYDETWIIENVRKALKLASRYGTTHIRAFADTDTKARLEGVKALIKAREEFKDVVEVQVVAFPQDGIVRDPGDT
jgi:cytosine deaminase